MGCVIHQCSSCGTSRYGMARAVAGAGLRGRGSPVRVFWATPVLGSGQNWVNVRVWHTGKPGLGLHGVPLQSSELATVGRRCAQRRHAGGWRSGRWNGLPALTIGLTGRGGKSEAHRGLGLCWEARQSRRRWSPAAWRRPAFEKRSLRGPRDSWAPRIDARGSCEDATGVRGLRDRRRRGNRGGARTFTFGRSGANPATQRARAGARATGACWSYGEASVGFSRG